MRVGESEKRMIERMRRSQRIIRERGNSIHCEDGRQSVVTVGGNETMGLVDDIPDAMAGIDEKDVAAKLHQLESMQEANEAMRAHIVAEMTIKADLEQELEKKEEALAVKERQEAEWIKEQTLAQEREIKLQHDLASMREALELGIQREADARAELQFHRENLSTALQRETDLKSAGDQKNSLLTAQLHDATELYVAAEVREANLQRQLKEALEMLAEAKQNKGSSNGTEAASSSESSTSHPSIQRESSTTTTLLNATLPTVPTTSSVSSTLRPSSLQRELSTTTTLLNATLPTVSSTSRPSSLQHPTGTTSTLFDVIFPDQASLGLVIVPHELQYDPIGNIVIGNGSRSPTTALPTSLRPLGEEPIIDCCMVTSSSVAHCILPGDVLLSVNGERLVSNRIDELHTEKHPETHFNKVYMHFFLLHVFIACCIHLYCFFSFYFTLRYFFLFSGHGHSQFSQSTTSFTLLSFIQWYCFRRKCF